MDHKGNVYFYRIFRVGIQKFYEKRFQHDLNIKLYTPCMTNFYEEPNNHDPYRGVTTWRGQ